MENDPFYLFLICFFAMKSSQLAIFEYRVGKMPEWWSQDRVNQDIEACEREARHTAGSRDWDEISSKIWDFSDDSPPARWGFLDFIRAVLLLLRLRIRLHLLRLLLLALQIPVGTAGPPPRAPDPSGHCRTSIASSRSQWALPDLNRDFQVAVGTAGPQPRLPDRSGHCRASTATSRSQWALPDLNGKNVRKDVR